MAKQSKAALELKRLRTRSGYSVRGIADALRTAGSRYGRSASSYAYYENDFTKPYLPRDLVDDLLPLLRGRGEPPVSERDVAALGGVPFSSIWFAGGVIDAERDRPRPAGVDEALLAAILEALSSALEAKGVAPTHSRIARLAARLYARLTGVPSPEQQQRLEAEIAEILDIVDALASRDSPSSF